MKHFKTEVLLNPCKLFPQGSTGKCYLIIRNLKQKPVSPKTSEKEILMSLHVHTKLNVNARKYINIHILYKQK